ncbi:unnamed protein product, partial [Chrysoparadoxa australica]
MISFAAGGIIAAKCLLKASRLWAQCRQEKLIDLPLSFHEMRLKGWKPKTPSQFQEEQLASIRRCRSVVLGLLYPALKNLLNEAVQSGSIEHDSHVTKYLQVVNVMTASVLMGLVNSAIATLGEFFSMYKEAAAEDDVTVQAAFKVPLGLASVSRSLGCQSS